MQSAGKLVSRSYVSLVPRIAARNQMIRVTQRGYVTTNKQNKELLHHYVIFAHHSLFYVCVVYVEVDGINTITKMDPKLNGTSTIIMSSGTNLLMALRN